MVLEIDSLKKSVLEILQGKVAEENEKEKPGGTPNGGNEVPYDEKGAFELVCFSNFYEIPYPGNTLITQFHKLKGLLGNHLVREYNFLKLADEKLEKVTRQEDFENVLKSVSKDFIFNEGSQKKKPKNSVEDFEDLRKFIKTGGGMLAIQNHVKNHCLEIKAIVHGSKGTDLAISMFDE